MSETLAGTEFPDWHYAVKVVKRQWLFAATLSVTALIVSVAFLATVKNVYRSTTTAILDTSELRMDAFTGKIWEESEQRNFNIKLTSPDFLHRVAREAQIHQSTPSFSLKNLFHKEEDATTPDSNEDPEKAKTALVSQLLTAIIPSNVTGDGTLTLTVDWDSPGEAQRIASQTMDLWIASELEDDLQQNRRRLEFLTSFKTTEDTSRAQDHAKLDHSKLTSEQFNDLTQKLETAQREARALEDQIAYSTNEHRVQRVNLEVQLARMRSRFTSDHPQLQTLEEELRAFSLKPTTDPALTTKLNQKRSEILALRIKLHQVEPIRDDLNLDTSGTEQLIANLRTNIDRLEAQLVHPELRTRFRVIRTATFENRPIKKRRSSFAILSIGLSLLLGIVFAIYRELSNTFARDAWRVSFHSGVPVWGQLSSQTMLNFGNIIAVDTDHLRAELGKDGSSEGATRALLGYRQIEVAMRRRCRGTNILLAECSTRGNLRGFFLSLFNIFSTDFAGRVLVIDCNHLSMLRTGEPTANPSNIGFPALIEAFTENPHGTWSSLIEPANAERPYDFIDTPIAPKGLLTRVYRETALKPLFEKLQATYDFIFVRGLPETHFLENSALASSCSDTLMIVDSQTTKMPELTRSARQLGSEAVRAIILVGT